MSYFLCALSACTSHACLRAPGVGDKKESDAPELELEMLVGHHVGAGN